MIDPSYIVETITYIGLCFVLVFAAFVDELDY